MKRRAAISLVSSSLLLSTGCLQAIETRTGPATTTASNPTATDLQQIGLTSDVSVERPATDDAPALVTVALTNATETTRTYMLGGGRPISDFVGETPNDDDTTATDDDTTATAATVVLVPTELAGISIRDRNDDGAFELVPETKQAACWATTDALVAEDLLERVELQPGDTLAERYRVLSDGECAPAGTYRFENTLLYDGDEYSWTLTLDYPISNNRLWCYRRPRRAATVHQRRGYESLPENVTSLHVPIETVLETIEKW